MMVWNTALGWIGWKRYKKLVLYGLPCHNLWFFSCGTLLGWSSFEKLWHDTSVCIHILVGVHQHYALYHHPLPFSLIQCSCLVWIYRTTLWGKRHLVLKFCWYGSKPSPDLLYMVVGNQADSLGTHALNILAWCLFSVQYFKRKKHQKAF